SADLVGTDLLGGSYRDRHGPPQVVDRDRQSSVGGWVDLRISLCNNAAYVVSLQGAPPDDRADHAIRREPGLYRPHLLRPGEHARRRRGRVRRAWREIRGRDRRVP